MRLSGQVGEKVRLLVFCSFCTSDVEIEIECLSFSLVVMTCPPLIS